MCDGALLHEALYQEDMGLGRLLVLISILLMALNISRDLYTSYGKTIVIILDLISYGLFSDRLHYFCCHVAVK